MKTVLVSSCLLGLATRYDGTDNYSAPVLEYLARHNLVPIPVCPEQLGGLPTPRPKCWFSRGDGRNLLDGTGQLRDENGRDCGDDFLRGAKASLEVARLCGCRSAILQERSPSCGSHKVYLNENLTEGMGVTAALLRKEGIEVISNNGLPEESC